MRSQTKKGEGLGVGHEQKQGGKKEGGRFGNHT